VKLVLVQVKLKIILKNEILLNKMKKLNSRNKICLYLGTMEEDNFNLNLNNERQQLIVNYLNNLQGFDKINQQCKYYYLDDMKYIITNSGIHKCKKDKIHRYAISDNIFMYELQEITIPIDDFKGITEYDDMRVVERMVFMNKDSVNIEILNIINQNNIISNEVLITCLDINKTVIDLLKNFNYNLPKEFVENITHGKNIILSII